MSNMINGTLHVVGIGGTLRKQSTSLWALEHTLQAAEQAGATTDLINLNKIRLPMYEPDKPLDAYGPNAAYLIESVRRADALIWSTAGYNGTLAAPTKNALDFLQFLSNDERPYLHQRVVGLIATAGGDQAAMNSINAMVNVAHALRGTVAPLFVTIPQAGKQFDSHGQVTNPKIADRLDSLGRLVVETAGRFQATDVAI